MVIMMLFDGGDGVGNDGDNNDNNDNDDYNHMILTMCSTF